MNSRSGGKNKLFVKNKCEVRWGYRAGERFMVESYGGAVTHYFRFSVKRWAHH